MADVNNPTKVGPERRSDALTDLNQTISGTYTQAEVQAISDRVDELTQALRHAGFLQT